MSSWAAPLPVWCQATSSLKYRRRVAASSHIRLVRLQVCEQSEGISNWWGANKDTSRVIRACVMLPVTARSSERSFSFALTYFAANQMNVSTFSCQSVFNYKIILKLLLNSSLSFCQLSGTYSFNMPAGLMMLKLPLKHQSLKGMYCDLFVIMTDSSLFIKGTSGVIPRCWGKIASCHFVWWTEKLNKKDEILKLHVFFTIRRLLQ